MTVFPDEVWDFDGVVVHGKTWSDESVLTGEPEPVLKQVGDQVLAGTTNLHGVVKARVERRGSFTFQSRVQHLIRSQIRKAPERTRKAYRFVWKQSLFGLVLSTGVAGFVAVISSWNEAATAWLALIWVGSPLAWALSLLLWRWRALNFCARQGLVFKSGSAFESLADLRFVDFDKTGTLTRGRPEASALEAFGDFNFLELLTWAAALERGAEHPLARAVVERALREKLVLPEVEEVAEVPGKGRQGKIEGRVIRVGSRDFHESTDWPRPVYENRWNAEARTLLYVTRDDVPVGVIACEDPLRNDAAATVSAFQDAGIGVGLLTGDREGPARSLAERLGIPTWAFRVSPQDKAATVLSHQNSKGPTAFVGDGINDAPALSVATVGVAMGGGALAAKKAGSVVLLSESLAALAGALFWSRRVVEETARLPRLSAATSWVSLVVVGVCGFVFGWSRFGLDIAAVVASASLWPLFKPGLTGDFGGLVPLVNNSTTARPREPKETLMIKKIFIDGMSCGHCAARIEKALSSLDGVASVKVNLAGKYAEVETAKELDASGVKQAVDDAGYHVVPSN